VLRPSYSGSDPLQTFHACGYPCGMSCASCDDLCQRVAIRTPGQLEKVVRVARANIEDGTIVEIANGEESTPLSTLTRDGTLPDIIRTEFRCAECGEVFLLRCETYHGSGGSWSAASLRQKRL
jgi:predicted RNA-binding Zn-ribbon protein involved in translation (DUF1610 family)